MISPAICLPAVRIRVVPFQKISFTGELAFGLKHGDTAFPIRERRGEKVIEGEIAVGSSIAAVGKMEKRLGFYTGKEKED